MRTWVIGDVHGCLKALNTLVDALQLATDDQLIFLGDLVDRGPDSHGVIDRILELRAVREVHVVQGNHEEMMLISRDLPGYAKAWQQYGGKETLASYGWKHGVEPGWTQAVPVEHWQFLRDGLVDAVLEQNHIMIHGGIDPEKPLEDQDWNELRWQRWDDPQPHCSGNIVICGHTHQPGGIPVTVGHSICIDTWVYGTGWLTALELGSYEYVQANQKGQVRRGQLEK